MKKYFSLILCGLCLLNGCGGGSLGGSPIVTLSASGLTFASEIVGTTSPAQTVTLSNSGTGTLNIVSIAASANFGEANTCGSILVSGAHCMISVTFTPSTSDSTSGTLLVSDNAPGSPQMVSLSGNGIVTGRCTAQGQQCPPQFPPCCPGLVCVAASTRAFCEPKISEKTSRTSSYWDQLNANKLQ